MATVGSGVETENTFKVFSIHPPLLESGKTSTRLAATDLISCGVQVVADGGENNLHAHANDDEIWLVLAGRARFYTTEDREVANIGPYEALVVPRGTPYWFETASEDGENLVILRFGARIPNAPAQRVDLGRRVFAVGDEAGGVARPVKVREGAFFNG
jgi:mannose-6-phosphate isomerase-like protein (cupin superfamily)